LDWIVRGPQAHIEKENLLFQRGPKVVVLTRGSDDACALFGDGLIVETPIQKIKEAVTVGADDKFNAGFFASLSQNNLLDKARIQAIRAAELQRGLEYGAIVAAVTVSRVGANPPWAHDL
jgi:fructokinase